MDRIPEVGFGRRELKVAAPKAVRSVLKAVRPGNEQLTAACGARLIRTIAINDLPRTYRIRPQPSSKLYYYSALITIAKLDFIASWRDQSVTTLIAEANSIISAQPKTLFFCARFPPEVNSLAEGGCGRT